MLLGTLSDHRKLALGAVRRLWRMPALACAVLTLLVIGTVLTARAQGWLQRPELLFYDAVLRARASTGPPDSRIVLCGMTEADLRKYGHPLDDAKLARLLDTLAAAGPVVIGLDLYRDLPEPRSGEALPLLAETLARLSQVIAIERVPGIPPPPALAAEPSRFAPNNLPKDHAVDGLYRRAYLFLDDGMDRARESLACALARGYLESQGVDAGLDAGLDGRPLLRLGRTTFPRLPADAGAYVGLRQGDYEIILDFRSPQHFREITFGDVLEGRVPAGSLAGTIVLAGTVMESVKDTNPTPLDTDMRGLTQHAMIVNQLLRSALAGEPPTAWWPEWGELAWITFCTALGGFLPWRLRSPWKLVPALAAVLAAIGIGAWCSLFGGVWILAATPALGCFVAAAAVLARVASLERTERRVMLTLFSKHVSSAVAEALWTERESIVEGGRLVPRRIIATVLFTDLVGFSTTSEKMKPAPLLAWMNEYMEGIASEVDRHGGMVNKYMGDAIMAVFGAPVAHSEEEEIRGDAVNAVRCALAMRRSLAALNAGWRFRGLPTTAMRVGIYTGQVVAGSIGSAERLEYTVLGDVVNIAARLESAGKEVDPSAECVILIGDSTRARIPAAFETQVLGPLSLKGRDGRIIVHKVLSEMASSSLKAAVVVLCSIFAASAAWAQDAAEAVKVPANAPAAAPAKRRTLTYAPQPASGSKRSDGPGSTRRIDGDGGTRGTGEKLPSLYVLTPDHIALTTREQPSLFWFQSAPAVTRFELTLIEPGKPKPLLKVASVKAEKAGIHRLSLRKHGVKLTPGVPYQWTVALVPDSSNRSQDLIASGMIQRVAAPGEPGGDRTAHFASKGIWYDAFESLTDEIDAAPKDAELRAQRAALLKQVGLNEAAAFVK